MTSLFGSGTHTVAKSATRAMGIDLQGAQYGAPIPVVFGQNKTAGNVVDYMDFKATGHQQKQPGKGGGGQSSTTYTYSASFLLGLCEGPASVVNVYQGSSTVSLSASGGVAFGGTIGQAPWAHLSGAHALGYSGTALAAFQNLELGSTASLPNFNFEMAGRNQFGGGIVDANPADIMTAICTDTQIGVNFGVLGDLTNFKNYCTAAGLFFSPVYATQNPVQQALDDLLKYANSAAWFSEGVLKVQPYGDATITGNGVTYTPNLTAVADLGRDDFITNGPGDPVTIARIAPADARNIQRVEFQDRANTYHTSAVVASIDQDVVANGARADQSDSVDMITSAPVARLVAQNLLQRTYYIRNTYTFQLSWRYCYLEPMDIVTLTDANTGLYLAPVRITEVDEDEHGLLSITAEEFPIGTAHGGTYATQPNAGTSVDANADPGAVDGPYLFRGPGFLVSNATPEIWCAVTGNDPLWGGCDVYLSHDGTSYTYLTTTSRRASYGTTTNALASAADPDTTSAPNVVLNGPAQLLGGTQSDADNFITLAMVDSEIIAYQTATLAAGPSYTLSYLRRGGYGSAIATHTASAPFVRLDENILRIPVDPSQIGQTVYLKFVSFNVFGKGGRTLADETAYTYVIGTNIELPDVPITPSSFAVLAVADGINLTWTNANPAAVGCTSIEYSTTGTGSWTVLAQVGPTTTSYHHSFTTGATYYYRARSRGPLVSAGWSSYTSTLSSAGVNVGAISTNATTAVGQVAQLPVINGGFDMAPTGYGWTPDSGTGWYTDTTGASPGVQPNCGAHHGISSPTSGAYRNNGLAACQPGQVYKTQALIKAVGANGTCYVYISWCDASGAEIGTTIGNGVTGNTTAGSYAIGTAPAGTVFARTCLAYSGQTAGYYFVDNVMCTQYPSNQSEVPNGGGHNSVTGIDVNGLALIDFTQAGHVSKNLGNIADTGTRFAAVQANADHTASNTANDTAHVAGATAAAISDGAGRAQAGFDSSGYLVSGRNNLDLIANSGSYAKTPIMGGSAIVVGNASFEAPVDPQGNVPGWSPVNAATLAYNTSTPYSGSQCLEITGHGTVNFGSKTANFQCAAGDVIYAQCQAYAVSGNAAYLTIVFCGASGVIAAPNIANTTAYNAWQLLSGKYQAPAGTAYAYIEVYNTATSGVSRFDEVRVTRQASLDNEVADGTTYGRAANADLYVSGGVNRVGLRIAGSGQQIGDQRNLKQRTVTNIPARVPTVISYSAAAGTPATATISVAAFTVLSGSVSTAYSAMSTSVTGTNGATVNYFLYFNDPGFAGGTQTLIATTNAADVYGGDGYVFVGGFALTFPTSGSGSGGGGGGGGGGCVRCDQWLPTGQRAGDIHTDDTIVGTDGGLLSLSYRVEAARINAQPCWQLVTESGASVTASDSTPMTLPGGALAMFPDMLGEQVAVLREGVATWERVTQMRYVGLFPVNQISIGGNCYWAGDVPDVYVSTHNTGILPK